MAARITDDEWDKLSPESFETHSLLRAVDAVDELRDDQEARRAAILAQWETGADGIHWIEYLTEVGKAAKLAGGGATPPRRRTCFRSSRAAASSQQRMASGLSASTRVRNTPSRPAGWARLKCMPTAWLPVLPISS